MKNVFIFHVCNFGWHVIYFPPCYKFMKNKLSILGCVLFFGLWFLRWFKRDYFYLCLRCWVPLAKKKSNPLTRAVIEWCLIEFVICLYVECIAWSLSLRVWLLAALFFFNSNSSGELFNSIHITFFFTFCVINSNQTSTLVGLTTPCLLQISGLLQYFLGCIAQRFCLFFIIDLFRRFCFIASMFILYFFIQAFCFCNEPSRYANRSSDRCKFFFCFWVRRCVRVCGSNNILDSTSPLDDQQDSTRGSAPERWTPKRDPSPHNQRQRCATPAPSEK
jgi:hypothetical protein